MEKRNEIVLFETEESDDTSVVAKFATTASDGKTYHVEHYSLDAYDHQNMERPKGTGAVRSCLK